ncbi:hypothetical protein PR048_020381 [Dryococelus australis]|uniref:Uncharacterized protein n=1 Tax=Dryococelus australis TaxID=614101 RepID=A0ABQ9H6I6_9NEOP|nr:hypothetical protein PR048_020381 [Dryococelus australis]
MGATAEFGKFQEFNGCKTPLPTMEHSVSSDVNVSDCDNSEKDNDYIPSTESGSETEAKTPAVMLLNTVIHDHTDIPKISNNTEEEARSAHSDTENSKKRKRRPEKWRKNILKRKRNMGEAYESSSVKHIAARKSALKKKTHFDGSQNLATMYRTYKTKCMEEERPYGKQHMYESILNTEYSISFQQPKKDQCSRWELFKNSNEEDKLEHRELFDIHQREK